MITLTNKQTNYAIENVGETLKVTGTVSLAENGRIISFSGNFDTLDGNYLGNFYYNENESGKSNKSISDIDTDKYEDADELLDNTIKELKQTIEEL